MEETIRIVDNQDTEIKANLIAGNKKKDGYDTQTYLDTLGGFKGHTWNASIKSNVTGLKLDWYIGEPK